MIRLVHSHLQNNSSTVLMHSWDGESVLAECRAGVVDAAPSFSQHWMNFSCLLAALQKTIPVTQSIVIYIQLLYGVL